MPAISYISFGSMNKEADGMMKLVAKLVKSVHHEKHRRLPLVVETHQDVKWIYATNGHMLIRLTMNLDYDEKLFNSIEDGKYFLASKSTANKFHFELDNDASCPDYQKLMDEYKHPNDEDFQTLSDNLDVGIDGNYMYIRAEDEHQNHYILPEAPLDYYKNTEIKDSIAKLILWSTGRDVGCSDEYLGYLAEIFHNVGSINRPNSHKHSRMMLKGKYSIFGCAAVDTNLRVDFILMLKRGLSPR